MELQFVEYSIDFREHWKDPYKDVKWFKDVAYWAKTEDGMTEYYDENGKLLKTTIWKK